MTVYPRAGNVRRRASVHPKREKERKGIHMQDTDIKTTLFIRAQEALTAYQACVGTRYPSAEAERWHDRFHALYGIIEDCRLVEAFDAWQAG